MVDEVLCQINAGQRHQQIGWRAGGGAGRWVACDAVNRDRFLDFRQKWVHGNHRRHGEGEADDVVVVVAIGLFDGGAQGAETVPDVAGVAAAAGVALVASAVDDENVATTRCSVCLVKCCQ